MTSKREPVKAIVVGAGGRGNNYAYYSIECPMKLQVRQSTLPGPVMYWFK